MGSGETFQLQIELYDTVYRGTRRTSQSTRQSTGSYCPLLTIKMSHNPGRYRWVYGKRVFFFTAFGVSNSALTTIASICEFYIPHTLRTFSSRFTFDKSEVNLRALIANLYESKGVMRDASKIKKRTEETDEHY